MTRDRTRVAALVLAAGRSARMGDAKQLLRIGEHAMLARTLGNIRDAGTDEIVVVLGFAAEAIRRELPAALLDGLRVVTNEDYALGMAGSLRAGLAAVDSTMAAALICLGDQPFVCAETMRTIVARYRESDAEIVIPHYRGQRGNPVLLSRSVFDEASALEGDAGFRTIFGRHAAGIAAVDVDDEGVVLDIDDRADYERLRERR